MPRRVALVTGSSRGIGAATAIRLAQDGHDVVVHYHREKSGASATLKAVQDAGAQGWILQADLSRWEDAERMFRDVERLTPGIEVLVNNAGIYPRRFVHDTSAADFASTLATNVGSMFACAKLAVPNMIEREWGRIVNLGSVLGTMGSKHGVAYASSKAAVLGLTKSLARELAPHGITVNAVAPGAIETDILKEDTPEARARRLKEIPAGRVGHPEEIAAAIAFLVRDDAAYVTGQTLHVNGGFLMP